MPSTFTCLNLFSSPVLILLAAFLSGWTPSLFGVCSTSLQFVCAQAFAVFPFACGLHKVSNRLFRDTAAVLARYQSEQGISSCLLQE